MSAHPLPSTAKHLEKWFSVLFDLILPSHSVSATTIWYSALSASIIFTDCRFGLAAPRLMHVFSLPVLFLPTSPPLTPCFQPYCLSSSQQEQSSLVSSSQDTPLPILSIINTYSFLKLSIFHCETNHNDKTVANTY